MNYIAMAFFCLLVVPAAAYGGGGAVMALQSSSSSLMRSSLLDYLRLFVMQRGLLQLCFQGKRSSSSIIHEISVSKVVFDVMILSREKENRSSYYNLSHYSKEKKVSRCIIICQNCIIDTQYYMPLPIAYDIILPNNSTMHMY